MPLLFHILWKMQHRQFWHRIFLKALPPLSIDGFGHRRRQCHRCNRKNCDENDNPKGTPLWLDCLLSAGYLYAFQYSQGYEVFFFYDQKWFLKICHPCSTIVIHFYYLASSFSFNAFYIAIDYFIHGYGIMTREIGFIFFYCIFHQS